MIKKYMPIIGMAFLFVIGISIALLLAPIFMQMNARADFSQLGDVDENSILVVVFYMAGILIFTAIILILGKRGKGKFLKYVIFGVVGITIVYTLTPIIGYVADGPLQLIWDRYDDLDGQTTFITVYDTDGDNDEEIILGTNEGGLHILDPSNNKEEWNVDDIGYVEQIEPLDLDSDGRNELVVLTRDQFVIYQYDTGNNYVRIYSDGSGDVKTFTSGDSDDDGIIEIYAGSWSGAIEKIEIVSGTSGINTQFDIVELIADGLSTSNSLFLWRSESTNAVSENPLLFVGTDEGMEFYFASNGTKWYPQLPSELAATRNAVFIDEVVLDDETMKFIPGSQNNSDTTNKVIIVLTQRKVLSYFSYDTLFKVGTLTDISEFGSFASFDALENIDGMELILKIEDRLVIIYSDDTLWDENIDSAAFVFEFDDNGIGAASANIDGDSRHEVLAAADSGFMYGEIETIEFSSLPCLTSMIIAVVLLALLMYYPEWYVVDFTGILIGAGVCAIIGISIAVFPILAFLIVLAVYDAISVYKTKHMIDLADNVMSMRLPIVLVIPKKLNYSFLDQVGLKKQLEKKEEREAMFMGLGDVIIPGTLVVSAFTFLPATIAFGSVDGNLVVAIGTLIGALLGFFLLMRFVLKGNPQAGLPLLNSGAIIGYLVSYYIAYQEFSFGLSGIF